MPVDWSPAPNTPGLKLKWRDGWIDVFPEDEFAEECDDRPRRNYIYKKSEPRCLVEYSLTVKRNSALLDYGGRFEEANTKPERDLYIGVTKLRFTDATRSQIVEVLWKSKRSARYTASGVKASWATTTLSAVRPFRPPPAGDRRRRGILESVLRPGQLRFRTLLLEAYQARCCITGSRVAVTLEAAHIMPYRGTEYDQVPNGLLLRADLHRLYDRRLLSVNPQTRTIHVARSLHKYPEYAALEGRRLFLPKLRNCHPARVALKDHWRHFDRAAQHALEAGGAVDYGMTTRSQARPVSAHR